ncbi:MAG: TetR/AcrR family transcriptional regulator [Sorangiineae bacterium]|nr:TetR/AcrR family transcriptional regulator [Sorangiineae bacterium]
MARLRDRLREATSSSILGAAEHAFATQGLSGARMEDIAAGAGVSVGTLYNYFADRSAILAALLESRRRDLTSLLDAAIIETEDVPFETALERILATLLGHFEAHRPFHTILLVGVCSREAPRGAMAVSPRETMRAVHSRVERLIQRGVTSGALESGPAPFYPAILMGIVRGVLVRAVFDKSAKLDLRASVPVLTEFFLHGAAAR